jgi:hypothetical protein
MPKIPRRQALELGAAAIVVGPSVFFSRAASASQGGATLGGLKAGQFTVKLAGVYDEVPGVVSVDLGGIKLSPSGAAQYSSVKIALASGQDTAKMTTGFKQGATDSLSVTLLASDGKTPSVTYQVIGAQAPAIKLNKLGDQILSYKVASLAVKVQKVEALTIKQTNNLLKVEIDGASAFATTVSTSLVAATGKHIAKVSLTYKDSTLTTDTSKVQIDGTKHRDQITLTTAITGAEKQLSNVLISSLKATAGAQSKIEISGAPKDKSPTFDKGALTYSKAQLTSIEFPKLEAGSDALVTETLTFKLTSAG